MRLNRAFGLALALGLGALACDQVANLDVGYRDAAALGEAGTDAGLGADVEAGQALEACPCDEAQGLSCCIPKAGAAYCTSDPSLCNQDRGMMLECMRANAANESVCCWHGTGGAGAVTSYAAICDGGAPACLLDSDCSGTTCARATCAGVTVGACGAVAPTCP